MPLVSENDTDTDFISWKQAPQALLHGSDAGEVAVN